jgi:hypothetical protein
MLERTDAITNEVLEPITFVLAYPTVIRKLNVTPSVIVEESRRNEYVIKTTRHTAEEMSK